MKRYIITIDQRTSSSKALLFDDQFKIIDRQIIFHKKFYPKDGWAEVDAEEIYDNTVKAISQLNIPQGDGVELSISIVNQRETSLIWDKTTGRPVYHAVLWQCLRGAEFCNKLMEQGFETIVKEKTGLRIDPYFSASGVKWILDNVESVRERAESGSLLFGTIDTWLIWKLTGGKVHATDYTNASRTMLFNINTLEWDSDLLKLYTIPECMFPEAKPSDSFFGETDVDGVFSHLIKIAGVIGNSHGALVGQMCFEPGMGKTTYGTGSSVMFNIGEEPVSAPNGMVCSIGLSAFDKTYYVLEGHVHSSGATLDWLKDNLNLIGVNDDIDSIAESVPNNGGVYFVPAFSGLGAPWWVPEAKASITGITLSTTKAHVVRAALESIAYQVTDVIELVSRNSTSPMRELRIDGEAANSNFLTQFQADILGFPVRRFEIEETSGLGSAILNACSLGIFNSLDELKHLERPSKLCTSEMKPEERIACQQGWLQSVHTVIMGVKKVY